MNRGSAALRGGPAPLRKASMRPRFMNRGSVGYARRASRVAARFNEAPIHESGKSGQFRLPDDAPPRFNEAPIHESGK